MTGRERAQQALGLAESLLRIHQTLNPAERNPAGRRTPGEWAPAGRDG